MKPSIKKISEYLCEADPRLEEIISTTPPPRRYRNRDPYFVLLRSVVSQQISVAAATTIFNRFLDLFEDDVPDPRQVAEQDIETLRNVGLSRQKAMYLQNVARYALDHDLTMNALHPLSDDEVISELTQITGVGRWTVEMLLMFPLDRLDVFPIGDVGIQNTMITHYRLRAKGPALKKRLITISNKWRPYRTIACKYLWNWTESDTDSPW